MDKIIVSNLGQVDFEIDDIVVVFSHHGFEATLKTSVQAFKGEDLYYNFNLGVFQKHGSGVYDYDRVMTPKELIAFLVSVQTAETMVTDSRGRPKKNVQG